MAINLGDRVKSKINGFEGVVVAKCQYIQQCEQVLLKPEGLDKDGNSRKPEWFDEPWVVLVKAAVHRPTGVVENVVNGKRRRLSGAPDRDHPAEQDHPE